MSNKDFIFDDFGHPFLNIHKFWCYPQTKYGERTTQPGRSVINSFFAHHCMYENSLTPFQMFYNLLLDAFAFPLVNAQLTFTFGCGELTLDGHSCPAGFDPSNRLTKLD
jgi:hypothetical protein